MLISNQPLTLGGSIDWALKQVIRVSLCYTRRVKLFLYKMSHGMTALHTQHPAPRKGKEALMEAQDIGEQHTICLGTNEATDSNGDSLGNAVNLQGNIISKNTSCCKNNANSSGITK